MLTILQAVNSLTPCLLHSAPMPDSLAGTIVFEGWQTIDSDANSQSEGFIF
ncbi:MAG: hypothetical protein QF552_13945 [Litorilituus sp.]|nr:hypothetical protein [Litorilituus sp.]